MKRVNFFDLSKQHKTLEKRFVKVFKETLRNSEFILGKKLETFEKNFAAYTGTNFAVGTSTGLDALSLALRALGVGPGDEVIVPAHTFIATALAVSSVGAKIVLVDVDAETLLMDPLKVKQAISERTKAIIPVHLYGQPVDMQPIRALTKGRKIYLVEDACQAHGASFHGEKCGSLGDLACFSFYPSKNLGAIGDGGMICVNDASLREKILKLRNYGSTVKYKHEIQGFNQRLDTLQAAILNEKLPYLDRWNAKRNAIAKRYQEKLKNLPQIKIPKERSGAVSAYHLYVIRSQKRDALKKFLEEKNISTGVHYPIPIHLQSAYKNLTHRPGDFPVTEDASNSALSLPMYPEMSLKDVDNVCRVIHEFYR